MSLEVPITLAPRYSVSVSLASPTGGALELLPPQTAIVAQLQPILRGEPGPAWPSAGVQAASEAARDAALAAEAQAENAATAASASAGAAAAARTAAEGAATSASGSAATATAQASIASTKAGEAATSASTASTQATAATAQASIASTKATEAAASAAAAASSVAPTLHAGAAKSTPDDADEFGYLDSSSSWALVKGTWAQLRAALKTSFDSVYLAKAGGSLSGALSVSDTAAAGSGSLAGALLNLTQTWNTTGTPTAILLNVTNTASNAGSLLMDMRVGSASKFKVSSDGNVTIGPKGVLISSPDQYGGRSQIDFSNAGSSNIGFTYPSNGSNWFASVRMNDSYPGFRIGSNCALSWSTNTSAHNAPSLLLFRDAANILALRNGLNAQTFRLYNTYTDASNYERGFMRWASNELEIGTEAGGTGTARNLRLTSKTQVGSATSYLEFDQATRSITGFLHGSYETTFTLGVQSFSVVDTGNTGQTIFSASIPFGFRANKITSGTIAGNDYSPLNLYANYYPSSSSTPAFTIGVYDTGGNGITDRLQIFNGDAGRMVLQCNSTGNISLWGATSSFPALKRNAAGLEFRLADDSGFAAISAATVKTQAFTVATLPSAASAGAGACAYVTDATASTFMSVVAGGGSNKVPVVSDGTNWLIG